MSKPRQTAPDALINLDQIRSAVCEMGPADLHCALRRLVEAISVGRDDSAPRERLLTVAAIAIRLAELTNI